VAGNDPTIKIKIETDATQASKGLDTAAKNAEGFGSRFKSTFAGVLSANVVQNLAGKVFDFGKQSIEAYKSAEETQSKFVDAMRRIPGASDAVTKSLTDQATALSQVTIYSAGQSKAADTALASYGLTGDQIKKLLPLVQDYAAKTGQDLPSAAGSVGKALLGQGRALKGVGIDFKNAGSVNANYAEIVAGLQGKVGGLAEEMGGTASGKMQIMQNRVTKLKVQLGSELVPALSQVTEVLTPLFTFIGNNIGWVMPLAEGILAVAAAFKVLNFVIGLFGANPSALLIMGIAIAVVLLGVAIYELATHWSTVWAFILGIIQGVWNWIQTAWDTITSTLQAPFLAFWGWIQGAWDAVLAVIQGVWNWISNNWGLLLGILFGPIGIAVALIVANWSKISAGLAAVLAWIASAWSTVYTTITTPITNAVNWIWQQVGKIGGWFSGVAGAISGAMSGVFNAIIGPFQSAWNWINSNVLGPIKSGWNTIANAVNSIHFKVDIPSWVPLVGGKGFEWAPPHVPTLAAGGLMTSSGLVFAHAGEVISPAPASVTRSGPAIVIEAATFTSDLDVRAFLRVASWEIQTQRI
jgi:phage-related protein